MGFRTEKNAPQCRSESELPNKEKIDENARRIGDGGLDLTKKQTQLQTAISYEKHIVT